MKKLRVYISVLCVLLILLSITSFRKPYKNKLMNIQQTDTNIHLFMEGLCCDHTTESGADEVYIIIEGERSDGQKYLSREPGQSMHWDMNDGDQPDDNPNGDSHCIHNKMLFTGDLENGQTWWLNVIVSEEDGGSSLDFQEKAAEVLAATGNPYAAGAAVVISALNKMGLDITNSDDWMGMFGVKITKDNDGKISTEWTFKEGISASGRNGTDPTNPNKAENRMTHDGSNYASWFAVY